MVGVVGSGARVRVILAFSHATIHLFFFFCAAAAACRADLLFWPWRPLRPRTRVEFGVGAEERQPADGTDVHSACLVVMAAAINRLAGEGALGARLERDAPARGRKRFFLHETVGRWRQRHERHAASPPLEQTGAHCSPPQPLVAGAGCGLRSAHAPPGRRSDGTQTQPTAPVPLVPGTRHRTSGRASAAPRSSASAPRSAE